MNRSRIVLFILYSLILSLGQLAFGQGTSNPGKFRHERVIMPGNPGPNRLRIDAGLLGGGNPQWQFTYVKEGIEGKTIPIATGGLSDLRIYNSSNREVPYLLIEPSAPEPIWLDGRLAPMALTKKTSGFQIDLGRSLLVDRVRANGLPAPFIKRCSLEASNDASHWTKLHSEATLFDLPAEKLRQLEIEFSQGEYRYLKFIWDDSASSRIPLPRSVSARLVSAGSMPPPLQLTIPFERRISEPGISRYRLRLSNPRLPISGIILSTANGNVLRWAKITEGRFYRDEIVPTELGSATLRQEIRGELVAAEMSIPITPPQESILDLVIEDKNNQPLEITEIKASFAYLPWIYFESSDGKALTARYGNPNLKAPVYDLEAVRQSAPKAKTAEAHWGAVNEAKVEEDRSSDISVPNTGSEIDLGSFRYTRKIAAGKAGLNILPLDAAVLANSRIADLRIAAANGRQIPYILEKAEEPITLDLPALEKIDTPRSDASAKNRGTGARSYYRLRLPFSDLPPSRLVLTTSLTVFQRHLSIRIERNPLNDRQAPWTESIVESQWTHAHQDMPAPALTLTIPSLKTAEMMVVVEEGDNSPIPITSARLLLPSYRLRFFRGSQTDLNLYYGNSDIDAPRYDLAILAPFLTGSAAEEIQLGPEITIALMKTPSLSSKLFWGILIAAVLALLALIVRLSKKSL